MTPRIHVDLPLVVGASFALPPSQSRHAQVLRLQPGDPLTLFNGCGGEWVARVVQMSRTAVTVQVEATVDADRELPRAITLALGMPANERMDAFIEKATELGAAAIQPLVCERSVLRLAGERAARRLEHWRGIAVAAAEQCGRTRVPRVEPVASLRTWLEAGAGSTAPAAPGSTAQRLLLSPRAATAWSSAMADAAQGALVVLSGPEGGLTAAEEDAVLGCGFVAVSLGRRILRADTAPLAVLAWCGLALPIDRCA
ncbi:MAG: 16S rRNA (uracil(1498)-N(3))-methyltransferase [Rhizobacter sp.]